jgi:hypothetical protein
MQPEQTNQPVKLPQPTGGAPQLDGAAVQAFSTIQAPSQANLMPETRSMTSTNISDFAPAAAEVPAAAVPAPPPTAPPVPPAPAAPQPQPPGLPPQPPGQPAQPNMPQPPGQPPMPHPPQPAQPGQPPAQRPPQPTQPPAAAAKQQPVDTNSTQNSLLISEIRENMVILNDGSIRAVVACESINYDLMSNEERDGVEFSYQNFLNTLYFPIQIVIQSRKIDIKPYLDKLEDIRAKQENMLLGVMMDDYLDFIFDISQQANIMRKDFFIVIPYTVGGESSSDVNNIKSMTENVTTSVSGKQHIKIDAKTYNKAKDEIRNRVSVVLNGLMNIGVRAGQLPTKSLSELYYNFYNPDTALNQPISDVVNMTNALYIKKGAGENPSAAQDGGAV